MISFFPFPICLDENNFSCNKNSQWQKLHFLSERHRLNKENQLKTKNFLKTSKLLHFYRLQLQIQSRNVDLSSSKDLLKKSYFLPIMANLARVGISCRQRLVRPIANSFESRARPATKILCGQSFSREICLERSQKSKRSVKSGAQLRTLLAKTSQFLLKSTHISSKWDVISI